MERIIKYIFLSFLIENQPINCIQEFKIYSNNSYIINYWKNAKIIQNKTNMEIVKIDKNINDEINYSDKINPETIKTRKDSDKTEDSINEINNIIL